MENSQAIMSIRPMLNVFDSIPAPTFPTIWTTFRVISISNKLKVPEAWKSMYACAVEVECRINDVLSITIR